MTPCEHRWRQVDWHEAYERVPRGGGKRLGGRFAFGVERAWCEACGSLKTEHCNRDGHVIASRIETPSAVTKDEA